MDTNLDLIEGYLRNYELANKGPFNILKIDDDNFYFLEDDGKYYVSEGKATLTLENAKKFESMEDMVKSVPIMRDWNWDYVFHRKKDGVVGNVTEKKWVSVHKNWEKENPSEYEKLYNTGTNSFIRITYP